MGTPKRRTSPPAEIEPRLPTLFGRLTLLLDSHERQQSMLDRVRMMRDALQAGRSPLPSDLEPERLLFELGCALSAHFASEEGPALFGTIARTRADLLPFVVDLKADHGSLLRLLARIERLASFRGQWAELPAMVTELLEKLEAHERAETEVIAAFFSGKEATT